MKCKITAICGKKLCAKKKIKEKKNYVNFYVYFCMTNFIIVLNNVVAYKCPYTYGHYANKLCRVVKIIAYYQVTDNRQMHLRPFYLIDGRLHLDGSIIRLTLMLLID